MSNTSIFQARRTSQTSPWRCSLVEERAAELVGAAAAAEMARSEAAAGSWSAAAAAERAMAAASAARRRRLGEPSPGHWQRLEILRHVVEDGSPASGRARSAAAVSQPALPKPAPFPQSFSQVVDFSRPDAIGARCRFGAATDEEHFASAPRMGPPIAQVTSAALFSTGPHYFGRPLAEAGWGATSVRKVALCRSHLLRRGPLDEPGASQLLEEASQAFEMADQLGVSKSASLPSLGAGSRRASVGGTAPQSPRPPLSKSELLGKCWSSSRSLIRASREAVQQGPNVK